MSKISRKSELSPSATGSNIDLGKNDGVVDMGRKSEPSVTSGGLGVSTEIQNIGGVSVSGGVSVDISPIDLGVNYDVSENAISVASGVEIPGGLLGVSGGLTVDLDTGEITGGSLGGEVAGLGINVSSSKDGGLGVEFTVQIPFSPIEISLGLGFPPKGKKPTPTPTPTPSTDINWEKPNLPPGDPSKYCTIVFAVQYSNKQLNNDGSFRSTYEYKSSGTYFPGTSTTYESLNATQEIISNYPFDIPVNNPRIYPNSSGIWGYNQRQDLTLFNRIANTSNPYDGIYQPADIIQGVAGRENKVYDYLNRFYQNYTLDYLYFKIETKVTYTIIYSNCSIPALDDLPPPPPPDSPPPPFPNPPPRKQNKMDTCCQENLKFLRAIYTRLGLAKFPGQLPATIIQEVPKEGEQPAEPPQVPINDFVDLLDWQFRRDDERWGQWVVQIDVKDADITKEGDQGKQVKFPNLAESIAEMEGQMLSLTANVDLLVALQVKNLAESGMARQEAIKGYLAAKAIIKYMAFKSSEIDIPIPMTFTAGAESISELLKESEGHIKGTDYIEKETLRDVYLDLLQAAAIIRAVHWQKIDSKNDTKTQLLNLLKGTVDLAGLVSSPKRPNDGEEKKFDPEQNFEDFMDSVEDGFRNTTGISDIQNPYGRTPDRRPRIREIGDNLSKAGGDE